MSSDDTRITTDDLLTHANPVNAADLTPMDGHPWEGDVGLAATMSDAFGQTQLVFTHGQTIIWGEEIVRAQLAQPDDGGMVPAVDFAALGWPVERAQTWLLGRLSQQRRGTLDLSDLAELAAGRVTADPELAQMAGWDGDQLDDVLNTLDANTTVSEWAEAFGAAPAGGDGSGVMTMTFTVTNSQVADIETAIADAIAGGHGVNPENQNRRGNAIAHVCCSYVS